MTTTLERLLEQYFREQIDLHELLAHKLFIRWMTGNDSNCPAMPLTDENMVEDENGLYYRTIANGYVTNPGTRRDIILEKKYSTMPYPTWLMTYCRKIVKEALPV